MLAAYWFEVELEEHGLKQFEILLAAVQDYFGQTHNK